MKQCQIIQELEAGFLKSNIPDFRVGDTVSVHTRIIEGDKERLQVFTGTVIARKGSCLSETFSIYRVSYGSGMEKVFMVHSPRIAKIEVIKMGDVRRGKLYYLRGASGKAAKVKELIGSNKRILAAREAKKAQ
ncbi:MAG: 50S ribosomal protein L19 [Chlamydiae bacterium]|nr:50S ribosomal protein L19 [Chlamydiota bacterium]